MWQWWKENVAKNFTESDIGSLLSMRGCCVSHTACCMELDLCKSGRQTELALPGFVVSGNLFIPDLIIRP